MITIKYNEIISFKLRVDNNFFEINSIHSNIPAYDYGNSQINFKVELKCDTMIHNHLLERLIDKIELPIGTIINCIVKSMETDGILLTIEGISSGLDPHIMVKFKGENQPKSVDAKLYNEVIKQIGKDITFEQYQEQAFMEKI